VITSLFGGVDSAKALFRSSVSEKQVQRSFGFSRTAELTYGEFDLHFFFALLRVTEPRPHESFVDIGSGCGRLVLAAAIAYEWELAAGIEVLADLHALAEDAHARLAAASEDIGVALAPCVHVCGEVSDALPPLLERCPSTSVAFIYATCWPSAGPYLTELSLSLAASLKTGSRVVTVDKQLVSDDRAFGWDFQLLGRVEMANYNTYRSTGYVYELIKPSKPVNSDIASCGHTGADGVVS